MDASHSSYFNRSGPRLGPIAILSFALGAAFARNLSAQQAGKSFSLAVEGPRPIYKAIELLELRHGWLITYEDAPYIHESDVVDQTIPEYRNIGIKARSPRGGEINVSYSFPSNAASVLQAVLDDHDSRGNPGSFRLEQNGKFLHIIPVQVKNGRGQIVNLESVLNVPIALPEHERTGIELLREICAAVGKATQTNVVVGTVPINVFASYRIRLASLNEPARVVLIRTLEGTNRKLSWSLLYDPGAKMYALNVLPVLQEVSHPFGGTIRREIP